MAFTENDGFSMETDVKSIAEILENEVSVPWFENSE
jgi:hypothetical protein